MGPTWGPSGADRTHVDPPCWPHELCYLGMYPKYGQSNTFQRVMCGVIIYPCPRYFWHNTNTIAGEYFLAATKQLYKWFSLSICLSVCLSVTPFWLCFHHCIITKLSGVIANDRSDVHAKGQGHRSKVKVTEVITQLSLFRTVTPVWIHILWWNDAYSLMLLRWGALLFLRSSVKYQGHTAKKIFEFDPDWAFPDCNSSLNSPMATKWCTKLEVA